MAHHMPFVWQPIAGCVPTRTPLPFGQYRAVAVQGEKLLDDEAERGIRTWAPPAIITRLLLMRRIPRPVPRECDLWRFRVLGAIIPDLDHVITEQEENLPTPANPIVPFHLRPALLAGLPWWSVPARRCSECFKVT